MEVKRRSWLARAVRDVFGERARVQRCQVHKTRNVVEQLPESMRPSVRASMRQAHRTTSAEKAKQQLPTDKWIRSHLHECEAKRTPVRVAARAHLGG